MVDLNENLTANLPYKFIQTIFAKFL